MKAIVIEEERWKEIFDAWLREVKERAADEQRAEDRNLPRFIQYWAHDLKSRVEKAR